MAVGDDPVPARRSRASISIPSTSPRPAPATRIGPTTTYPLGRGDPLEAAGLLVAAGHVDPAVALDAVTGAARTWLGRAATSAATVVEGDVADVVALPAASVAEPVAAAPADRLTFRAGQLVTRRTSHSELRPALMGAAAPS